MASLMRLSKACLVFGVVCLCGCASSPRNLVLAPVGPSPYAQPEPGKEGTLVVFSARDPGPDLDSLPYRDRYTSYQVLSTDGKQVVQKVRNDNGGLLGSPSKVPLAVGSYHVLAQANGYGLVTVPVVIQPHQVTTVHLEGSFWWPRASAIYDSNPVRLPSGEIVGWPAGEDPSASWK